MYQCRSVPHRPTAATRTSSSPVPGPGPGSSCSRTSDGPWSRRSSRVGLAVIRARARVFSCECLANSAAPTARPRARGRPCGTPSGDDHERHCVPRGIASVRSPRRTARCDATSAPGHRQRLEGQAHHRLHDDRTGLELDTRRRSRCPTAIARRGSTPRNGRHVSSRGRRCFDRPAWAHATANGEWVWTTPPIEPNCRYSARCVGVSDEGRSVPSTNPARPDSRPGRCRPASASRNRRRSALTAMTSESRSMPLAFPEREADEASRDEVEIRPDRPARGDLSPSSSSPTDSAIFAAA